MKEKLFSLIKAQLDLVNEELEYDSLKNITEQTEIFGGDNGIDSLSLVRVVVGLEGAIQKEFGKKVLLSDEKAMSAVRSPYRSVQSLIEFAQGKLEAGHE